MYTHSLFKRASFKSMNYRRWFSRYSGERSSVVGMGYSLNNFHPHIRLRVETGGDTDVTISINCLFYFYLSFYLPKKWMLKFKKSLPQYEYDREISLAIHHYSIWWNFWTSNDSGRSSKYRKGNFDVLRFLLGDWKVITEFLEEGQYTIYTDIGVNNIVLQKQLFIRCRDRWYTSWYKFKSFRWNYEYAIIEDCVQGDNQCYCRLKGALEFDYNLPKDNYEKLTHTYLKGATKMKWDCDETQGGSFYEKGTKELDQAYLYLIGDIYKNKLKFSRDKYKNYENTTTTE